MDAENITLIYRRNMTEISQISPRHKLNPPVCCCTWRLAFLLVHVQHTTTLKKKLGDYSGEAKKPEFLIVLAINGHIFWRFVYVDNTNGLVIRGIATYPWSHMLLYQLIDFFLHNV